MRHILFFPASSPAAKRSLAVVISLLATFPFSLFGQGGLTPPGAPAPTMKSLDQIQPRAAITNSGAVTISTSGSYYLTTNITVALGDAVTINADNVTLDLNGFTISSTKPAAAGTGILLAGTRTDVHILNGHVRGGVTNNAAGVFNGSGFANGIFYAGIPHNVRVSGVSVSGCLTYGINVSTGNGSLVESCTAFTAGSYGIAADVVTSSTGWNCGLFGIVANIALNSFGNAYSVGTGITATTSQNCYGLSGGSGIGLTGNVAHNGVGISSSGTGVNVNLAFGCLGSSTSGTGLAAGMGNFCYCVGTPPSNVTLKYNMP